MKATKITTLLVIALALTMAGTGCRKKPVGVTDLKNKQYRVGDGEMPGGGRITDGQPTIDTTGFGTEQKPKDFIAAGNFNVNATALAAHIVHFDYDSSVIKSNEKGNVQAVADYLTSNASVGLRIEGHCDERGTEGYNDSLGDRRALALRDAVLALGVSADRVITLTFGERKPVAQGQDEASYRQNRRGEFMVLEPK